MGVPLMFFIALPGGIYSIYIEAFQLAARSNMTFHIDPNLFYMYDFFKGQREKYQNFGQKISNSLKPLGVVQLFEDTFKSWFYQLAVIETESIA